MLLELCLVVFYCVHKSLINNLAVNNVMFYVSRVIIIESYPAFFDRDTGAIVKVHVDS